MVKDPLHYDRMLQEALRGVVRAALSEAAENGLPGNHHFLVSFRTDHPGAVLSEHLRVQHGPEMTIVLQHHFWGLEVGEGEFEVTLSFQKVQERLTVPFAAITRFLDPAASFGLQLQPSAPDGTPLAPIAAPPGPDEAAKAEAAEAAKAEAAASPDREAADTAPAPADKVVALDSFRKT